MAAKRTEIIYTAPKPLSKIRFLMLETIKTLEAIGKPVFWAIFLLSSSFIFLSKSLWKLINLLGREVTKKRSKKKKRKKIKEKKIFAPQVKNHYIIIALILLCLIGLAVFVYFTFLKDLPDPNRLVTRNQILTTKIYDRHGKLLYKMYRNQNRTLVPLSEIPTTLIQATIATEDAEFYHHRGLSIRGVVRSLWQDINENKLYG